jgi:PAS domain S-box-containing protein
MTQKLKELFAVLGEKLDPVLLLKAIEQNPATIVITDPQGSIIYVNKKFSETTGYSVHEVLGKNPRILKGNDELVDYEEMWRELLAGREWRGDFHNKKKNGEFYWERASISPIFDENGRTTNFLAIKEDITGRKQIEETLERSVANATQMAANLELLNAELKNTQAQMLQREKMASIGTLAAGVAHEINNPIGFIASNLRSLDKYINRMSDYLSLVEKCCKDSAPDTQDDVQAQRRLLKVDYLLEDSRDLIAESLEGAERVRTIVQNLKTFSRLDQAAEQEADLNECLESTISIVWNEIKYKARLEKKLGELPSLYCNPQELTQVFTNILVNAAQAIEKEGVIRLCSWSADDTIFIRIEDNGCGIKPEHRERIFEPFFSTKPVGEGTGLGMSISYEIIKNHGGEIQLESEFGRGTSFLIALPLSGAGDAP